MRTESAADSGLAGCPKRLTESARIEATSLILSLVAEHWRGVRSLSNDIMGTRLTEQNARAPYIVVSATVVTLNSGDAFSEPVLQFFLVLPFDGRNIGQV